MFGIVAKSAETKTDLRKSLLDKWVKDRDGRVALVAAPNLPILVWLVARLAEWLPSSKAEQTARVIAFGAIFTWAWLELFQGINYFRRTLGLVVLTVTVSSAVYAGHLT